MSSGPGSLAKVDANGAAFNELNTPAFTAAGVVTPAQRKARSLANLGLSGSTLFTQAAPTAFNATATITAAALVGGVITSTTAAAVVATLPAAATMEAAMLALNGGVALPADASFQFSVINTGANTFTFATASGWTDGGGGFTAVAAGTTGVFLVRRTAANTFVLYKVG